MDDVIWAGQADCPLCPFRVIIESPAEEDFDLAIMAAQNSHAEHEHPGLQLVVRRAPQEEVEKRSRLN